VVARSRQRHFSAGFRLLARADIVCLECRVCPQQT